MAGLSDQEIDLIAQRIVADLTGRGGASAPASSSSSASAPLRDIGIFDTIDEAVKAASVAFCQFDQQGLRKRNEIIASIRQSMREHGTALARMAHEETGLGRFEDKILKNQLVTEKTPGPEDLLSHTVTGDDGLTLTEPAPFGVIGAITPELVRAAKKLKWVQVTSAGVENFLFPELRNRLRRGPVWINYEIHR